MWGNDLIAFKNMENGLYCLNFFKMLEIDNISNEVVGISVQAAKSRN